MNDTQSPLLAAAGDSELRAVCRGNRLPRRLRAAPVTRRPLEVKGCAVGPHVRAGDTSA